MINKLEHYYRVTLKIQVDLKLDQTRALEKKEFNSRLNRSTFTYS